MKIYDVEIPVVVALALRGHEGSRQLLADLSKNKTWVVCCVRRPKLEAGEDACYSRLDCQLRWEEENGTGNYGPSYSHPIGADVVEQLLDREGEILPNVWLERLAE